jgi:hypothetical protein
MKTASREWNASLFPHTHFPWGEAKRILSFFDTMTIFRPWHMEDPGPLPREWGLKVLRPPEHLRPIEGFRSLLSEYKEWMRLHPDKGYASALAAVRFFQKDEDATWEIRRTIRRPGRGGPRADDAVTRHHLLLHLAREAEEGIRSAGEALKVLKEKGDPLRDAGIEGEPQGLLDDLSHFDDGREMGEEFMEIVLEAWQGLFGGILERDAVLVTLSGPVFDYVSGVWAEHLPGEERPSLVRFCWPDLSEVGAEEFQSRRSELHADERLRRFREAVGEMKSSPAVRTEDPGDSAGELESNPPWAGKTIAFRACLLSPEVRIPGRMEFLRGLSGRILFHLGEPCRE